MKALDPGVFKFRQRFLYNKAINRINQLNQNLKMKHLFFTTLILSFTVTFACGQIHTLPYLQDFEGGTFLPQDWQAFGSNANAAWEHSTTVGAYGNSSGSAYFDNFTTDLSGNFYGMRAVTIDLFATTWPVLTFDVAYARKSANNSDRLGIWYSLNGTTGWMNVMSFQDATLTTAPDQATYFTPLNSQWDSITIDLTAFAGTPMIRFAFENNCDFGNVMYIDNVHFYDKGFPTGITDNEKSSFDLYPNPTNGFVTIRMAPSDYSEIQIFNIIGQQFYDFDITQNSGNQMLDLSNLPEGVYFISISSPEGELFSRMIILE